MSYYEENTKGDKNMKLNVNKDMAVKIVGGVFTIGAAVYGLISDKKKDDEIAAKAAEKVMKELSSKQN